ncbi:MAG: hypothetical protein KJ558_12480 [Gammaproteobacteria bacterium]|nr:hypothetical protein [Gammaproteobacteria bacterium]MBU1655619.1 hypothetical protein [Gammaproteobacteria bacterium]MBU1962291.1 hypothetical protein [Gammaproteobacteria bacterium]
MTEIFDPARPLPDSAAGSVAALKAREQAELAGRLAELKAGEALLDRTDPAQVANHRLEKARTLMGLERGDEAWPLGRAALDTFLDREVWEEAADCCDVLFRCNQPASLAALGQGIWLAVTFPMDPELGVHLLTHLVDETPDKADGAAVAAVTALFLVDHRVSDPGLHEKLHFFTSQILGQVARRHSGVENQQQFDLWMERLELNEPDRFLPRLRNVIDVLVQDDWWFDRALIQSRLPEE